MRIRNKVILVLIFALALTVLGDWEINESISSSKIGIDDNLNLTIKISGEKLDNLGGGEFPTTDEWAFVGRNQSTSTNFQIINGKMSRSNIITYVYTLAPRKKGRLNIPSLTFSANGGTKTTKIFNVEVVNGSVTGNSRSATRGNQTTPQHSAPEPAGQDIKDNLFLSVHVNKNKAYVGEQITVTYALYTRYNISELSMSSEPEYNGFWVENIYQANNLQYERKVIDGVTYNVVVLNKTALFGLSPGEKTIKPMELDCSVITGRSAFSFFHDRRHVTISANPKKINVEALPVYSNNDFNGLVGEFSLTGEINPENPKSNEAMSYVITISGTGNIHKLKAPDLQFPKDFELYDIQESENISKDYNLISGTKRFEYILVPRNYGEYELPEYELTYFDLKTKTYVTRKINSKHIVIEQGKEMATGNGMAISKGEVVQVGEDIRYIFPNCNNLDSGSFRRLAPNSLLLVLLGEIILFLITILIKRRRDKLTGDVILERYTRARKRALRELKKATSNIENNEVFVALVHGAILHYLADRLKLPREGVVFAEIRDRLTEQEVDDESLDDIEELLEKLNFLRFAPGDNRESSQELLEKTQDLLSKLDKNLK